MEQLSADLVRRGVRGLSPTNLRQSRQFYRLYPQIHQTLSGESQRLRLNIHQTVSDEFLGVVKPVGDFAETAGLDLPSIPATVSRKSTIRKPVPLSPDHLLRLSWSHVIELIRVEDPWKRAFYENGCLKGNWSVRQLQRQIGSLLFERTGLSKDKAAVIRRARRQEPPADVTDLLRNPYILEFTGLGERPEYTESDLEGALLDHLQQFLLELGTGFCFEGRQKRITVGSEHDYIDLVFYHRRLRCHVLVELKTRPFTHGDAGQMNFYLNWWKAHGMDKGDELPVGILLCSDQDRTKVEFATVGMNNKMFVSRYLVALPSQKQLREFVERDRAHIEAQMPKGRSS